MADTQEAPHPATQPPPAMRGSIEEAHEALLSLMDPEQEKPEEEEAQPTEEEESTEETQDESLEEEDKAEDDEEESDDESEEDEEESEESDEDESDEEPLFTVTANGEEIDVTYDELVKGYSRQADYTKKTQELAEHRNGYNTAKQEYETALPRLHELQQEYTTALANVIETSLSGMERFNIDWNALKEEDREEYLMKSMEFNQEKTRIDNLKQQHTSEQKKLAGQLEAQENQYRKEEMNKLVSIVPELRDPEQGKNIMSHIQEYSASKGFSGQELMETSDHRMWLVLIDAMLYDTLSKTDVKSKKVKNKPKVVRSGKGTSKKREGSKQRAAKMKRLQQTGRVDDAALLMEDFVEL